MSTRLWDAISLSILPIMALPVLLCYASYHAGNIVRAIELVKVIIGMVLIQIAIKILHSSLPLNQYCSRPLGAHNCNLYNQGGDYSRRVGMPSGHVMMTSFILVSIGRIYATENNKLPLIIVICVAISLMAISRVKRSCHTILQVCVGAIVGSTIALLIPKNDAFHSNNNNIQP